jgi:hypothetical protein
VWYVARAIELHVSPGIVEPVPRDLLVDMDLNRQLLTSTLVLAADEPPVCHVGSTPAQCFYLLYGLLVERLLLLVHHYLLCIMRV